MNPQALPQVLKSLSITKQQLIARISPCINIYMLKYGGISSSGHCVTFPQDDNEPAQIVPRLSSEVSIIKVRREGPNYCQ